MLRKKFGVEEQPEHVAPPAPMNLTAKTEPASPGSLAEGLHSQMSGVGNNSRMLFGFMLGLLTASILGALLVWLGEPNRKAVAKGQPLVAPQLDELPQDRAMPQASGGVPVFQARADEEALRETPSEEFRDVREARIDSGDSGEAHSDSGGMGGFNSFDSSELNAKDAEVQRAEAQVAEPQFTGEPHVGQSQAMSNESLQTPPSSLKSSFDAAVSWIQSLPKDGPVSATNDERLVLYGLFKQATIGDNRSPKPGMFTGFEARFKWDAWERNKGKDAETAMREYVEYIETVKAKYKA